MVLEPASKATVPPALAPSRLTTEIPDWKFLVVSVCPLESPVSVISSIFRNPMMLAQLVIILVGLTALISLGWVVVDRWGEGSW